MGARRRPSSATTPQFELVDLLDYALPHLDEAIPASRGQYENAHTRAWADKIASFDGFVFVTPEYNHSTSGALKNAIDFIYGEWNDKAAGLVSYGVHGGVRAAEHLRLVLGEVQIADVRQQVSFAFATDFVNYQRLRADRRPGGAARHAARPARRVGRRAARGARREARRGGLTRVE